MTNETPPTGQKGKAMKCVNCQADINPGGIVCPYCHFHPFLLGVGPYDGASGHHPMGYDPLEPRFVPNPALQNKRMGTLRRVFHALTGKKIGSTIISQPGDTYTRYRCNKCGFDIIFSPETHCSECGNEL
jgi:DNA-directed RNA polymerase subunit RPC12/RpoP